MRIVFALAVLALTAACGTGTTATNATSAPAPTSATAAPAVATPDETPSAPTLRPADIDLRVKTLKKACFGSAGCNVTYTVRVTLDVAPPEGTTYLVTYRVTGGEDPQINTLTLDGTTAQVSEEEFVSTRSSAAVLRAKVTEVERL